MIGLWSIYTMVFGAGGRHGGANLMPNAIDLRLREIDGWDRARCLTAWTRLTGQRDGVTLSTQFLRRALALEHQFKALGGQSATVRRQLRSLTDGEPANAGRDNKTAPKHPV